MSQGMIYNIQRMSVQDGPGLRTTVFLKGCPLRCLWCSNPESQQFTPQMLLFDNLCVSCGACAQVCPNGAVVPLESGKMGRDTEKCTHCGACTEVCPNKARVMSGRIMTVEEVMEVVRKDWLFYENSGGGVTFGGGEPTAGGQFFLDLVQTAHDEGLHVTVDTCGFCPEDRFDKTIGLADLFLFDCKHMDPEQHKKLTGRDNANILDCLRYLSQIGQPLWIRHVLVPGITDVDEYLYRTRDFIAELGDCVKRVEVLPYHTLGIFKWDELNIPYKLRDVDPPTPERTERAQRILRGEM